MAKRCVLFLLVLIFCFQLGSVDALAANDAGSPKHIPRVVSIVFDDSGSMYKDTDRWAYTSYAMQSFAAMMGSEDVLYITYLNAPAGTVKVDLSDGAKHETVSGFYDIMFGGGTPKKVQEGADCLIREFANYKDNAKYYLVVMADGELDSGLGELSDVVRTVSAATEARLSGADFETVYFSMKSGDSDGIPGITSHYAATSDEIVNALKDVSADIMGRTEVKHTVSGGKVSFTLEYPALSIAVFAQKQNGNFDNFKATVQKDGKNLSCQVGNYNVKCPTQITKNYNTSVYQEKIPEDPPAGVVSLITNGGNSLPKGSYSIDVSGYNLQSGDIVVLVEPAVRIGCKYRLNNDDDTITFEELKKRVCEGDTVWVECGLYELNADGSLGDPVPMDVLSPEYKILINGEQVGSESSDTKNLYQFQVEKKFENQELRVEALLEGYQPFVLKETFGQLNIRIQPVPLPDGASQITLTKPTWKTWSAGEDGIRFELEKLDESVLDRTAIEVEGIDGLPEGLCSGLGESIRVEGNTIVYLPNASVPFSQLPDTFTVRLKDLTTSQGVMEKTVKVIRPAYRFETENALAGSCLNMEQLKNNTSAVTFTLTVDYEGNGQYIPVSQSTCEEDIQITLSAGVLPGQISEGNGQVGFVPRYDPAVDTVSLGELLGKDHSLSATAVVDGQEVKSETVTLSVSSAAYRLEVENQITQPLSLDTVKDNQLKVIFRLLADYDGSGMFGQLADWDTAALDKLTISAGDLPGKTETVYDAGGKPVGKAFIPQYDENNNNGIPFTVVAGKTHQITGAVTGTDLSASTTVEVLAPDYDIIVRKDGISLVNTKLHANTEGVEFVVLRDGRPLTAQELEGLAPYDLSLDKKQPWMKITPSVMTAEDGAAYLMCLPEYDGWTFPFPGFWFWITVWRVRACDMNLTWTLGEDVGVAKLTITRNPVDATISLIILAIIAFVVLSILCWMTTVPITTGKLYTASFERSGRYYVLSAGGATPRNANKGTMFRHFRMLPLLLIPFRVRHTAVSVHNHSLEIRSQRPDIWNPFKWHSYPYAKAENAKHFLRLELEESVLADILKEKEVQIGVQVLQGQPFEEDEKMDKVVFMEIPSDRTDTTRWVTFYLTKKEEKELLEE